MINVEFSEYKCMIMKELKFTILYENLRDTNLSLIVPHKDALSLARELLRKKVELVGKCVSERSFSQNV